MNEYEKALREFADECLKDETWMKSEAKEWIFGAALFVRKPVWLIGEQKISL